MESLSNGKKNHVKRTDKAFHFCKFHVQSGNCTIAEKKCPINLESNSKFRIYDKNNRSYSTIFQIQIGRREKTKLTEFRKPLMDWGRI